MPTSRGLDVSSYQGAQDWKALARSGITFAFAKASEGMHSHDSRFATHIAGIIAAGLVPGAYHYGWPTQDPEAEAANYIAAVHAHRVVGFLHVLDLEKGNANYGGRSGAQIKAWAATWITAVKDAFPHDRVGVYTSASDIQAGHMPGNAAFLWYPAYPSGAMSFADAEKRTAPAPSGLHPLFWQFTSTPIDRNLAYLSPADLRTWAAGDNPEPQHTEEDPLPEAKDLWAYHGQLNGKPDPHDAYSYLRGTNADVKTMLARQAAQNATIATLATALASVKGIDTKTLVAAVEAAIDKAVPEALADQVIDVTVHDAIPATSPKG